MQLSDGWTLVILGGLLLAGYAAHAAGHRVGLPRVTLLLLLGVACGPSVLDLAPTSVQEWFPLVTNMTLALVGFLLGERFMGKNLKRTGRIVLWVSIGESVLAAVFVVLVLWAAGAPPAFALLLAGVAPASDPAATVDVARDAQARGSLTDTVLGVVAIDDAWGVMLFSVCLVGAEALSGVGTGGEALMSAAWEVVGGMLVGALLGFPMSKVTGRLRAGEPALIEAVGFIFLCGGLATVLHVSYLIAAIVLGAVVANQAKHYTRPFHVIKGVSDSFLTIFFILAGFGFQLGVLGKLGLLGMLYVIARVAGKAVGAAVGARFAEAPPVIKRHIGWCLLPQAGVALGMALLAKNRLPELGAQLLPLVIATTVLFELLGPPITKWRLRKAGEIRQEMETPALG